MPDNPETPEEDPYSELNRTKVGEKVFYIHENALDGRPSLKRDLKIESGDIWGLHIQNLLFSDLRNCGAFLRLFHTAREAFESYMKHVDWELSNMHQDQNRPGDISARKHIQENANRLIQDMARISQVEAEARAKLDTLLADTTLGKIEIPHQEHLLGEKIVAADGTKHTVCRVELKSRYDEENHNNLPHQIYYRDERGFDIDMQNKEVAV